MQNKKAPRKLVGLSLCVSRREQRKDGEDIGLSKEDVTLQIVNSIMERGNFGLAPD
jgi:hypothetical protein